MKNKDDDKPIKFEKGSEWRKWDLHVHTPETKLNNHYISSSGIDIWDKFCKKIESSDVSVFGITDYFSIDNYTKFIEKFKGKYSNSNKVFFPNIEFRIESKNSQNEHIQIHVIFSDEIETIQKIPNFLTRLELLSTDNHSLTNKYCTKDDLDEVGYDKVMVKVEEIKKKLKNDFNDNEYLVIGVANGYGSLRPNGSKDGRGSEYAKELDKKCDLFFGTLKNTNFFLNKENGREQYKLLPKAVITGSDAHSFKSLEQKLGKVFEEKNDDGEVIDYSEVTWIKADPTFEGLRQILYEPQERVRIQENNPSYEYNKPYFESLNIDNDLNVYNNDKSKLKLKKANIQLNKNLVTVIGGRGEGKSTLINYIANTFQKYNKDHKKDEQYAQSEDFSVIYNKVNTNNISDEDIESFLSPDNNELDFVFIKQGDLNRQTQSGVSENLKKLLGLEVDSSSDALNQSVSLINEKISTYENWLNLKNEDGELKNSIPFQQVVIDKYTKLINGLTNSQNKSAIESYNDNLTQISEKKNLKTKYESVIELTDDYLRNIDEIFKEDNKQESQNIEDKSKATHFKKPDLEKYKNQLDEKITVLKQSIEKIQADNVRIKYELEKQGIVGDLSSLLENIENYTQFVTNARNKENEINKKILLLEEEKQKRSKLSDDFEKHYEQSKTEIENTWDTFLNKHGEKKKELVQQILFGDNKLKVEAEIVFDKEKFYELLEDSVHKGSYKKEKFDEDFGIVGFDAWIKYISEKLNNFLDNTNHKNQDFLDLFFDPTIRKQYLRTEAKILYDGKEVSQLSAGQKGTALLRIQLANSAFDKPIVFDQPEDDLDNSFIMSDLVDIFKELKKYRQIIIVTHNANLVVNADAEQVIVAKNKNNKIEYQMGSLENPKVKNLVCEILEGGEVAFEKRKNKYNFH